MTHLVLVGLMGAGKSTVGRRCATRLDRPFVDTDELVEAGAGATVEEIFRTDGEAAFRVLERRAIADVSASPTPLVVACGGGAVLDADNRAALRRTGCVVWLDGSPEALAVRVGDGTGRPLLTGGVSTRLASLAASREPSYEAAAHARVDTTDLSVDAATDAVLEEFARCDG